MPSGSPLQQLISRWSSLAKLGKGDSSCIGLDIGASSIQGVKVRKGADAHLLLAHAAKAIPSGGDPSQRVSAVQDLLRALGAERLPVVTAVGGTGTVLRSVVTPKMTTPELKTALTFEAEKYIPFKLDEVFVDSAILGDQPGGKMEVFVAAARKEVVNAHLEFLSSAGVVPAAVDLEPIALANAWELKPPHAAEEPACLLHMAGRGTILNVMLGTRLQFTREIPLGGEAFTQAIADGLQVPPASAEPLKLQPGERAAEVRLALQPVWDNWLSQCRTSFDFYENQFGRSVAALYLSGGSAQLAGFQEWLGTASGLPAKIWNPLDGLKSTLSPEESKAAGPALGVAVGLAVRGGDP